MKSMIQKLIRKLKVIAGVIRPIVKEVNINYKWYGNKYGGFYVQPNFLNSNSIIYSFGIGEDISFDRMLIDEHKCQVFGFDPTPKSIEWINSQQLPSLFTFFDYGIDSNTGYVNFNLPKNKNHISGSIVNHQNVDESNIVSVPMKCLKDIANELGHDHIDILKMDIEGSEFEVIDNILSSSIEIEQILIELHERFFVDGKTRTEKLLKSLRDNGYKVFAVSDSFEEVSFIKMSTLS